MSQVYFNYTHLTRVLQKRRLDVSDTFSRMVVYVGYGIATLFIAFGALGIRLFAKNGEKLHEIS